MRHLVVVGVVLFPLLAPAAELPTLAVLPYASDTGTPPAVARRFDALLADELLTRDTVLRTVEPPKAAAPPGQRAEALKLIATGKRQAAGGQFGPASGSLRRGITAALADPATAPIDEVVEALLTLAVAELRTGDEKSARTAMAQAVRLAPALRVKAGKYPPVFVREFDRVRQRTLKSGAGALVVDAPAGARVFVDGRSAGTGPVRISRLPSGTHYLRIEGEQGSRAGAKVDVEGAETQVSLRFAEAVAAPVPQRTLTATEAAALAAYAQALGADFVLLGVVSAEGGKLRAGSAVYSQRAAGLVELPDVELGEELAGGPVAALNLVDALAALLSAPAAAIALPHDLLAAAPAPPAVAVVPAPAAPAIAATPDPMGGARGPNLFAKVPWWVWAGGAALVVGGVATAGIVHANRPVTGTVTAAW